MKQGDCKHTKMWDRKTNKVVKTICPDCGLRASASDEEVSRITNELARKVTDDAEARKLIRIGEDASALPQTVQFLRRLYPQFCSTSEVSKALGMDKETVRNELKSSRRVEPRAGKAHGDISTALWRYKPTAAETPWSSEYVLSF
jgi:hypothetical protein